MHGAILYLKYCGV